MVKLAAALVVGAALVLPGAAGAVEPDIPLHDLAQTRGILVGAAAGSDKLLADADYARVLSTEYGSLTPENEMK